MAQNDVNGDPDDAHPEVDLGALMGQARQHAQARREPSAPSSSTATTPADDATRPDVEAPIQRNVNAVQAELNASTVRVFGTIAEGLRSLQERIEALEGDRSGEQTDWVSAMLEAIDRKIDAVADQTATLDRHVNGEVADLRQALRASAQEIDGRLDSEVALNARARQDAVALEERLVRALDELMRGMHASVNGVETWMRQETERSSQARRRLGDVEDRLARAFDQLSQDVSE
ncbi:MAG: hypothetical protein IT307_18700, partial [Chloroflexi bacterium]|nr:hypothetical protein [Chloroflexota bacterium]